MRKAILLYNPLSGRRQHRRLEDIKQAADVLRDAAIDLTVAPTANAEHSAQQAREAAGQGCDTVFACGGDGTVHDILQGLAETETALGIIPLGTANAMAHDLGIPLSPAGAARAAVTAKIRRVAVGRLQYQDLSGNPAACYFVVAAGIGVDAQLFHALDPGSKLRFGMLAYYTKAVWLWLTLPLTNFGVEYGGDGGLKKRANVSELLAVRIRNFGGALRELAPGASLHGNDLRLVLFKTSSRWRYLQYIVRGLVGARWTVSGIDLANSTTISCQPLAGSPDPVYVEADGEILGTLPVEISMVPNALNILTPNA